ncbi:copper transport protein ctr1 [Cymbomonas tetramitiformis]|uniref:Copper transport protein ctr1 n=1 Tax=Cymbomonas tetramitiformis TaxID=36881 RepID=A0AAE0G2R0_9CHLO|nr:copper transport protein ctr1 [Cymbomonas tetramitiformis]
MLLWWMAHSVAPITALAAHLPGPDPDPRRRRGVVLRRPYLALRQATLVLQATRRFRSAWRRYNWAVRRMQALRRCGVAIRACVARAPPSASRRCARPPPRRCSRMAALRCMQRARRGAVAEWLRRRRHAAAVRIQRHWRGVLGRAEARHWSDVREFVIAQRRAAAALIQRWERGRADRARCHARTMAIVRLQSALRGREGRRQARDERARQHRHLHAAATVIQKWLRGHSAREHFKVLRVRKDRAATAIQAFMRGIRGRAEMGPRKAQRAARRIQRNIRVALARWHAQDIVHASLQLRSGMAALGPALHTMGGTNNPQAVVAALADAAEIAANATAKRYDAEARDSVAATGSIGLLVQLLQAALGLPRERPEGLRAAEAAALTLCHLARTKNLRLAIHAAGASAPLVAAVRSGRSATLTKNAVKALFNVATLEETRQAMRAAGCTPVLVPHLRHAHRFMGPKDDPHCEEVAIRLFASMCECGEAELEAVQQSALIAGAVEALVQAVGLSAAHLSAGHACRAAVKLLGHTAVKEQWRQAGGIKGLVELLVGASVAGWSGGGWKRRRVLLKNVLGALGQATASCPANQEALNAAEGCSLLLYVLQELLGGEEPVKLRDPGLVSEANLVLRHLAMDAPALQDALAEAGAVPLLLHGMRAAEPEALAAAAAAAKPTETQSLQQERDAAAARMRRVARTALAALGPLLGSAAARREARASDVLPILLDTFRRMQRETDKAGMRAAAVAVKAMVEESVEEFETVEAAGMMPAVIKVLGKALGAPVRPVASWWKGLAKSALDLAGKVYLDGRVLERRRRHQQAVADRVRAEKTRLETVADARNEAERTKRAAEDTAAEAQIAAMAELRRVARAKCVEVDTRAAAREMARMGRLRAEAQVQAARLGPVWAARRLLRQERLAALERGRRRERVAASAPMIAAAREGAHGAAAAMAERAAARQRDEAEAPRRELERRQRWEARYRQRERERFVALAARYRARVTLTVDPKAHVFVDLREGRVPDFRVTLDVRERTAMEVVEKPGGMPEAKMVTWHHVAVTLQAGEAPWVLVHATPDPQARVFVDIHLEREPPVPAPTPAPVCAADEQAPGRVDGGDDGDEEVEGAQAVPSELAEQREEGGSPSKLQEAREGEEGDAGSGSFEEVNEVRLGETEEARGEEPGVESGFKNLNEHDRNAPAAGGDADGGEAAKPVEGAAATHEEVMESVEACGAEEAPGSRHRAPIPEPEATISERGVGADVASGRMGASGCDPAPAPPAAAAAAAGHAVGGAEHMPRPRKAPDLGAFGPIFTAEVSHRPPPEDGAPPRGMGEPAGGLNQEEASSAAPWHTAEAPAGQAHSGRATAAKPGAAPSAYEVLEEWMESADYDVGAAEEDRTAQQHAAAREGDAAEGVAAGQWSSDTGAEAPRPTPPAKPRANPSRTPLAHKHIPKPHIRISSPPLNAGMERLDNSRPSTNQYTRYPSKPMPAEEIPATGPVPEEVSMYDVDDVDMAAEMDPEEVPEEVPEDPPLPEASDSPVGRSASSYSHTKASNPSHWREPVARFPLRQPSSSPNGNSPGPSPQKTSPTPSSFGPASPTSPPAAATSGSPPEQASVPGGASPNTASKSRFYRRAGVGLASEPPPTCGRARPAPAPSQTPRYQSTRGSDGNSSMPASSTQSPPQAPGQPGNASSGSNGSNSPGGPGPGGAPGGAKSGGGNDGGGSGGGSDSGSDRARARDARAGGGAGGGASKGSSTAGRSDAGSARRGASSARKAEAESYTCPRCGQSFSHRIRMKLHWCSAPPASRQQAEPVKSSEREAAALKQQWDRFLRGAEEQEARRKAGEAAGGIQAAEEEADFDLAAVREQITEMIEKSTHGLDKVEYLSAFGIPVVGTDMKNLKGAYRRAAMRYHPDKNRGVGFEDRIFAEEAFKAITLKMGDLRG